MSRLLYPLYTDLTMHQKLVDPLLALTFPQKSERTMDPVRSFTESKVTSWRTTAERTVLKALGAGF